MSHWVYLERDGETVSVDRHEDGGTYALGGTTVAELNITYNYGECFRIVFEGYQGFSELLSGRTAESTIPELAQAVERLGTRQYKTDYWAPTPGNAGHALSILLGWAQQHPDAIWRVS